MLHLKAGFHAERGAFLDGEGVVFEVFGGARFAEVDDDVRTAFDFQSEGFDDDAAWVFGVADGAAAADS